MREHDQATPVHFFDPLTEAIRNQDIDLIARLTADYWLGD